jgi:hypothetical protein
MLIGIPPLISSELLAVSHCVGELIGDLSTQPIIEKIRNGDECLGYNQAQGF